jgi:hypothetical protein
VDLTFGEYLRALITADRDLVPDDTQEYRVAFVSAFRARGIYPPDVSNLSVGGLTWRPPEVALPTVEAALRSISDVNWTVSTDRYDAYMRANAAARDLRIALRSVRAEELSALGLHAPAGGGRTTVDGVAGKVSSLEIHSVRPVRRVTPDGDVRRQTVIEILQRWTPKGSDRRYVGGCTLICDAEERRVVYSIRKRLGHGGRQAAEDLNLEARAMATPYASYFDLRNGSPEQFAVVHREEATHGK